MKKLQYMGKWARLIWSVVLAHVVFMLWPVFIEEEPTTAGVIALIDGIAILIGLAFWTVSGFMEDA